MVESSIFTSLSDQTNFLADFPDKVQACFEAVADALEDSTLQAVDAITYKKDKYKTFFEMVTSYDYPIEKTFYETSDGHINCLFRISGPRGTHARDNTNTGKPVIVYQHGLLDSGRSICLDGENSLAFLLADAGFDVWMNNSRGSKFSRHHKFFDPHCDDDFWDYSFHEMGTLD